MKTISFTNDEINAIQELVLISNKACSSGCVYEHMQNSNKDCNECEFTRLMRSISDKIGLYD